MSTWDSEDFEPTAAKTAKVDKWEKEEEDKIKDNWDENDEDSEEESEEDPAVAIEVKKKSQMETPAEKEKIAPEDKAKQPEAAVAAAAASAASDKSAEPSIETTKSDVTSAEATGQIDQFEPTNKEQFDRFGELLKEKITKYELSSFYVPFLESLLRDASANLEADDVKKILNTVNAVSNEKVKQHKAGKGKKKPKKATLVVGKDVVKDEIVGDADYDEFDDYV